MCAMSRPLRADVSRELGSDAPASPETRTQACEFTGTVACDRLDSAHREPRLTPPRMLIDSLQSHPSLVLGWISLAALALVLGRSNARAARDWCTRHGISYRRDGKHNFARIDDIARALEELPAANDDAGAKRARGAAARAAASIMSGRRR